MKHLNMKKYEGISLPIYGPWDLERARPASRGVGGVGERKDMKHVNMKKSEGNIQKL